MLTDYYEALLYVARSMVFDFGDRGKDLRLAIGDCCPAAMSEDCPGHPRGSHVGGKVFDGYYYTNGEHNYTQASSSMPALRPIRVVENDRLTGMFDRERNAELFRRILNVFPDAVIMVNVAIENFMRNQPELSKNRILGDRKKEWNHDKHFHCNLGDRIDYATVV